MSYRFAHGLASKPRPSSRYSLDRAISKHDLLVVFDGVSSIPTSGAYAERLMSHLLDQHREARDQRDWNCFEPLPLLSRAYTRCRNDGEPGAVTSCVAMFDHDARHLLMHTVGDAGFMLIRNGAILARSVPKFYGTLGIPLSALDQFHITTTSDKSLAQRSADNQCIPLQLSNIENHTRASDGDSVTLSDIRVGDLILLASDGLWDNMAPEQVLAHVHEAQTSANVGASDGTALESKHMSYVANCVANHLLAKAQQYNVKPDDTTVIAAYIIAQPATSATSPGVHLPTTPTPTLVAPEIRADILVPFVRQYKLQRVVRRTRKPRSPNHYRLPVLLCEWWTEALVRGYFLECRDGYAQQRNNTVLLAQRSWPQSVRLHDLHDDYRAYCAADRTALSSVPVIGDQEFWGAVKQYLLPNNYASDAEHKKKRPRPAPNRSFTRLYSLPSRAVCSAYLHLEFT